SGYPADEAATLESLRFRQSQAGDLFLGAYEVDTTSRKLIGYVCATLSPDTSLSHESMSRHVPGSGSVCIHSVCVASIHRKKGIASQLLREYLARLRDSPANYERILLISHEELIPLYTSVGFELVGPSQVQHGARPWFEMCVALKP
ncbi:acyl-CoA N-acyltransferase, partial [Fistulina hepatica ATCC 64428]